MEAANKVHNMQLLTMLKQAEKAQRDKHFQRMHQKVGELQAIASGQTLVSAPQPSTPLGGSHQANAVTPIKTDPPKEKLDTLQIESVSFTLDEIEWLEEVAKRHGYTNMSGPVRRLTVWANAEPPEAKKKLFLVIRCRRCSAGAKGGVKSDRDIELSCAQWQWLQNVKERCNHASVGKTIRIVLDFYMGLCKDDENLEQQIFRVGTYNDVV